MKINLGCGLDKKEGYIGIDRIKLKGVDIICNLEEGLPFKDNSINNIYTSHVLEHINNLIGLMEEIWRICKPDSIIKIIVPYFACSGNFGDITHVRSFTTQSFEYFGEDNRFNYYSHARFKILKRKIWMFSPDISNEFWYAKLLSKIFTPLINIFPTLYEVAFCFILPSRELRVTLEVIKNGNV